MPSPNHPQSFLHLSSAPQTRLLRHYDTGDKILAWDKKVHEEYVHEESETGAQEDAPVKESERAAAVAATGESVVD